MGRESAGGRAFERPESQKQPVQSPLMPRDKHSCHGSELGPGPTNSQGVHWSMQAGAWIGAGVGTQRRATREHRERKEGPGPGPRIGVRHQEGPRKEEAKGVGSKGEDQPANVVVSRQTPFPTRKQVCQPYQKVRGGHG